MMRAQDGIPKKRMAEALHAYTRFDPAFAKEAFGRETVIGRALVQEPALGDGPLPDVSNRGPASGLGVTRSRADLVLHAEAAGRAVVARRRGRTRAPAMAEPLARRPSHNR
jgi:hypothetical protein